MLHALRSRLHGFDARHDRPYTPEQAARRARWKDIWSLPIVAAAIVPFFVSTSSTHEVVAIAVGVGSWLIFFVDLVVQRRIAPDYLRRPVGWVDLTIVVLTFPYYLLPNVGNATAFLVVARLARVARLLLATKGLRRFMARLGRVAVFAGIMVIAGSLLAYDAEHPQNPGYATIGDAFWWGVVTLTTVGYGDIVPETTAGRLAGVGIMFTGVAVLGILAGSLASLFGIGQPEEQSAPEPGSLEEELHALRSQVQALDERLGQLIARQ